MTPGPGVALDLETVSRAQLEPVFALDQDASFAYANDRFLEIAQRTREAVIGDDVTRFDDIVEDGFDAFRVAVDAVMAGASAEERVEVTMHHPEGAPVPTHLPAEARLSPIQADDAVVGVLVTLRDVTKRKEHERRLRRQNDRLEEFAGVVSHDLRNPLNVAQGHLALARKEADVDHLGAIEEALDRMGAIIDDTLTLAKQGRHVGELERVALAPLAEQCWTTVGTSGATLDVIDGLEIEADPTRLRNLFENLFRNAIVHGGEGVTVRLGPIDDEGFFVEDDGPGVPAAERDRIFDLGYSRAEDGTGFGLAIVLWIAEAHGWAAAVTEGTDGGGARFEFTGVSPVT